MMNVAMKLDPKIMNANVAVVMHLLEQSDDLYCIRVCNMYMELCKTISENVIPDSTAEIMERLEKDKVAQELRDNIDRPTRHNVNPANRPSLVQEKYGKEDTKEEHF